MKKKLIVLAVLSCLSNSASADLFAWRIEPTGLKSMDTPVEIQNGQYLVDPNVVLLIGIDTAKLTTRNGLIDLAEIGEVLVDMKSNTLKIKTRADLLPTTSINMVNNSMFMEPSKPSGTFVNYDVRADRTSANANSLAGLFEANTFGLDDARFNLQTLLRTGQQIQRMAATVSKEDQQKGVTWSFGDGFSMAGAGVPPTRFVGFQYRKDFSLSPGFITSPTVNLSGTAASPSTIDVLIGNQIVRSQSIPAGPFSIQNIQPTLGSGGAYAVVTDVLGDQKVIGVSATGNPSLLREGLNDFAMQAGALRPSFDRAESVFVSGFYRRGITSTVTVEGNVETSQAGDTLPSVHHLGGNTSIASKLGNLSFGGRVGTGQTISAGYQNAWHGSWYSSLSANVVLSSRDYAQLGGGLVSPRVISVSASMQKDRLSFNGMLSESFNQRMANFSSSFSPSKADEITWSVGLTKLIGASDNTSIYLSASMPLDGRASAGAGRTHTSNVVVGNQTQSMDYQNRPKDGFGGAYKARIERGEEYNRAEGFADVRTYSADAGVAISSLHQSSNDQTALRGYARGALVFDGSDVLPTRYIDNGFATVDAGVTDARVLVNGTPTARTNKNGKAAVSGFPPFLKTAIRLQPSDLPDNYDDVTREISTFRKAGTSVKFSGHSMTMVQIPSVQKGVLKVEGQVYPVTDRGAFLELPEGQYIGTVNGKSVSFSIPSPSGEISVVVATFSKNDIKLSLYK